MRKLSYTHQVLVQVVILSLQVEHGKLIFYNLQVVTWCMTVAKPSPKTFIFDLFEYMHQISMFLFRQFLCMRILFEYCPLREKCPHSDLFWSIFSRIRIEYREIRGISPYSARMRENADQNNSEYGHFSQWSCAVPIFHLQKIVN